MYTGVGSVIHHHYYIYTTTTRLIQVIAITTKRARRYNIAISHWAHSHISVNKKNKQKLHTYKTRSHAGMQSSYKINIIEYNSNSEFVMRTTKLFTSTCSNDVRKNPKTTPRYLKQILGKCTHHYDEKQGNNNTRAFLTKLSSVARK